LPISDMLCHQVFLPLQPQDFLVPGSLKLTSTQLGCHKVSNNFSMITFFADFYMICLCQIAEN